MFLILARVWRSSSAGVGRRLTRLRNAVLYSAWSRGTPRAGELGRWALKPGGEAS